MAPAVIDASAYRAEDTLPDGRPILIRAIGPKDRDRLREGFHRLSERSVYLRFFQPKRELSEDELTYFTEPDFVNHVALGAIVLEEGLEVGVGVGRYVVDPSHRDTAEIALTVDDPHQGIGVGRTLMQHLAKVARANGIVTFRATLLAANRRMLDTLGHVGPVIESRLADGAFEVLVSLTDPAT